MTREAAGMAAYRYSLSNRTYRFADLRELLAKATPHRSGDVLAGIAAADAEERVAAQLALAELPLKTFLNEAVIPYEADEVTRLIIDRHDADAFAPISSLAVGDFRNWLLSDAADEEALAQLAPGLTPEMVAAVSKIMRLQDLVLVARKCRVVTRFRNTLGLLYGSRDAVIGINPASDSLAGIGELLRLLGAIIREYEIPTQGCVLTPITTTIRAIEGGAPVDLVFQSIAGTEAANRSFGVDLALLREGREAALALGRGTLRS